MSVRNYFYRVLSDAFKGWPLNLSIDSRAYEWGTRRPASLVLGGGYSTKFENDSLYEL
jgi:hypothetical protein